MYQYKEKITNICIYMMSPCVFIIFSVLLLCLETTTANRLIAVGGGGDSNGVAKECLNEERHALLHFKASLQDPKGSLSTWRAEEDDCCKWQGVTCNNQTGHVIELKLISCGLVGEISHSLVNLSYLTHLDLLDNSFHGTIPTLIGSMTQLRYLNLGLNKFNGTIPRSIGSLTKLWYLNLGSFGGGYRVVENLEWLSHLSHLENLTMDGISLAKQNHWVNVILSLRELSFLSLEGCELSEVMYPYSSFLNSSSSSIDTLVLKSNNLNSSMYRWLFPLTSNKLNHLVLSYNMLDGIPKYLGNVCSLKRLYFRNNFPAVRFREFLNNLSGCASHKLQMLDVSGNQFTGSFSDEIQKFSSLEVLDTVPTEFWDTRPQLYYLNLSSNKFSGKLPDLSSNFGGGSMIDLSFNSFYGPIRKVSSTLQSLNLSRNKFSGGISFLCQIVDGFLSFLDLSHNSLTGPLPDCLWHFKELRVLNLGHNNLSGRLPPSIGSLMNVEMLYLYKNDFSGELPLSLKNCTRLISLNLGANKFSGNVPVWIGEKLSELYVLVLKTNNFSRTIPSELCRLPNLQVLDLSRNQLHGTIPSCLSNLTSMVQESSQKPNVKYRTTYALAEYDDHAVMEWLGDEREFVRSNMGLLKSIDLSSNNLTGQIPYQLTNLYELLALNLSKNALQGEIPPKIGEMKNLLALDLSQNKLSGRIPSSMSQLTFLGYLDVSFNNLSGRIPTSTQLQSFASSRYDGNTQLCGLPLTKKCPVPVIVGESGGDREELDELEVWFYIGGGTGFVTGFWIACGALLLNRRGRHAFYQFYDRFIDWVYVKVVVFIAKLQRVAHT